MFQFNEKIGFYHATLPAGTRIFVSKKRMHDYAFNATVMALGTAEPTEPFEDRFAKKLEEVLQRVDRWRTRHDGFDVIVVSVKVQRGKGKRS